MSFGQAPDTKGNLAAMDAVSSGSTCSCDNQQSGSVETHFDYGGLDLSTGTAPPVCANNCGGNNPVGGVLPMTGIMLPGAPSASVF